MQRVSSNPCESMKAAHLVHACMQVRCMQLSLTAQHPMHLQTLRRGAVMHRLDDGEQCRQLVIGKTLALRQADGHMQAQECCSQATASGQEWLCHRQVRCSLRLPHSSCNAWQQQRQHSY